MKIERDLKNEEYFYKKIGLMRLKKREGIHVTDLTGCLRRAYYRIKGVKEDLEVETELRMEIGKILEELTKMGEMEQIKAEKDGIIGTVDAIDGEKIIEKKMTYYSSNKGLHEDWIEQGKAYCKIFDRNKVQFRIIYLLGDYKRPFKPEVKFWIVEFDKNEIDDFWEELLMRRDELIISLEENNPPPMEESYRCKNCGYRRLCHGEDIYL